MKTILSFSQFVNEQTDSNKTADDSPVVSFVKKLFNSPDVLNPNASLLFDGDYLYWMVNGAAVKRWNAISGLTWKNTPPTNWPQLLHRYTKSAEEFSKEKQAGPTPPGKYIVGKIESRNPASQKSVNLLSALWTQIIGGATSRDKLFQADSDYSRISWGDFRAPITPQAGTNTYGRGSFYIHGGMFEGSHGCIDLTNEMEDFAKFYQTWLTTNKKSGIVLTVNYKKEGLNSFISKLAASAKSII